MTPRHPRMADEHGEGKRGKRAVQMRVVGIYVDRTNQQWAVRDGEGNFWLLPSSDDPWGDRQQYSPDEGTALEPVPGHYRDMLGLPH